METYIRPDTVFTSHVCNKIQKLIEKHVREHLRIQFTAGKKKFQGQLLQRKRFCQNSNERLGPEESQKSY